ncbi:MAG TPA: hypothetical protein VHG91_18060 [Longimicrobium sp.]|nr:hypothetical protein [Longimicrobium sp.]
MRRPVLLFALVLFPAACEPARPPADALDSVPGAAALVQGAAAAEPVAGEPYVARGACPFECCRYNDAWAATEAVRAFAAERDTSRVAFTISAGERFTGVTGNVHLDRVGVVVVRRAVDAGRDAEGSPRSFAAGDTVHVLDYLGEDFFRLRHRGRVLEAQRFWGEVGDTGWDGELVAAPVARWWAKVRDRAGREGWVDMDAAPFIEGVDACG